MLHLSDLAVIYELKVCGWREVGDKLRALIGGNEEEILYVLPLLG